MKIRDIVEEFCLAESDIQRLLDAVNSDSVEVTVEDIFAEGKNKNVAAPVKKLEPVPVTQLRITSLFKETQAKYANDPRISKRFKDFIDLKSANPIAKFGSKDYPIAAGPLKGLMHAGMDYDVSLFYSLQGKNPTVITLYGFFTHDESGTGQPQRRNRQQGLADRIDHTKID